MKNYISVVIITRNRAEAIKNISLPSLFSQKNHNFEIVISDASDDEETFRIVKYFTEKFDDISVKLRYFKAPRLGIASQRNDIIKETKGNIIFFIDDDSEVSSDGIAELVSAFEENPGRIGISLPLQTLHKKNLLQVNSYIRIMRYFRKLAEIVLIKIQYIGLQARPHRVVLKSALNIILNNDDVQGDAEWLTGCDMAFRREIFNTIHFDERLEEFSGYAIAEDVDFSHRSILIFKQYLLVASCGFVRHHLADGGRISDEHRLFAARFFNRFILRENFGMNRSMNKFYFYSGVIPNFLHSILALSPYRIKYISRGFFMARKAMINFCKTYN